MAFQLQYGPQFVPVNAFEEIMRGAGAAQQMQTNALNQESTRLLNEKQAITNASLDQMLMAELQSMLAGTEQAQLQSEQMRIAMPYQERLLESDIAYKEAIGTSSQMNAQNAAITNYLMQQKLPSEIAKIKAEEQMLALNTKVLADYISRITSGNATSTEVGANINPVSNEQVPLPPLSGTQEAPIQEEGAEINSLDEAIALVQGLVPKETSPNSYLPPKKEVPIDLGEAMFGPKFKSGPQLAGEEAYASQEGTQLSKSYHQYANKAAEDADAAGTQNDTLQAMKFAFGNIPDWNKGEVLGYLKDIPSESQLYTALHSGATLEALKLVTGTASEGDRKAIEQMFGGRTMNDEAMRELLTLREVFNDREIKKLQFISEHSGDKRTVPEIENAWQGWMKDNSVLDNPKYINVLSEKWKKMDPEMALDEITNYLELRRSEME